MTGLANSANVAVVNYTGLDNQNFPLENVKTVTTNSVHIKVASIWTLKWELQPQMQMFSNM